MPIRLGPLAALSPLVGRLGAGPTASTPVPDATAHADIPGRFAVVVLRSKPVPIVDLKISRLERHPYSAQTFLPIVAGRWLVLAVPSRGDGSPDCARTAAFLAGPEDGICIRPNIWHAALTVFDRPAEMAMMMWCAEHREDGVVQELATPLAITE